jgi:superfamily II DNA or RNA helicase
MSAPPKFELQLNAEEQLRLVQLLQVQSWSERLAVRTGQAEGDEIPNDTRLPAKWQLLPNVVLYDWQKRAADSWFKNDRRGIIKVVTGAGKTTLALAIAQRLQEIDPDLRLAIVVPTVVLMEQWQEQLLTSNLPRSAIGTLGGGTANRFDANKRILICVLNSAAQKLPELVNNANIASHLLLVVDECHRAGAAEMRKLFAAERAHTLGLSATPERDDDSDEWDLDENEKTSRLPSESILEREIGKIVFELTYAEAIRQGILPEFVVQHYALSLQPEEAREYNSISQEITDLRRELETPSRRGLALIRWCRSARGSKDKRAVRLISLTVERKQLLYRMKERLQAVEELIRSALAQNPESRVIIFHESISEVMRLFRSLQKAGYRVVAEHSELPDRLRAHAISLFRRDIASVIVSARSLIEGFNVPSADIGIIVAASSSVRQRIQTLGRLLRRPSNREETKQARLIVLYAVDTVDEMIYEKADWDAFIGAGRNEYYKWSDVRLTSPEKLAGPPRTYVPDDTELDPSTLNLGEEYPGRLVGKIYSVDVGGTIRDANGGPIQASEEAITLARGLKGGGKVLVTPARRFVVRLPRHGATGKAEFLGQLSGEVEDAFAESDSTPTLVPGAEYPFRLAEGKTYSVLQRDSRLIAQKEKGTVRFVKSLGQETDPTKSARLRQIQNVLHDTYRSGRHISKVFVNYLGHVGYIYQGKAYFVGIAPEGSAGFTLEEG